MRDPVSHCAAADMIPLLCYYWAPSEHSDFDGNQTTSTAVQVSFQLVANIYLDIGLILS
ncbi:hypothetical protein BJX66DRAFT_295079 [Aspergillus keveii]|uniref:Uncharacterized protein n=1 Tax=Aspergillus keveii TaxID=714993 RepID=A0ABR4GJ31_9EURO